jgi:hypothetical protein
MGGTTYRICLGMASLLCVLACNTGGSEPRKGARAADVVGNPNWKQKLREEAPKAWAELEEFYRHMRGSFAISDTFFPENKARERQERGDFALNGDLVKEIDPVHQENINLERVMAKNDLYAFSISRRAGDAHAQFAIERLEKLGADASADKRIAFEVGQTEAVVFWPWRVNGRSLPDWMKTPPFSIKDVTPVGSGTTATVRVEFEGMRVGPDAHTVILSGYMVFNPADHWVVLECLTRWPKGGTRDAVFEYARRQDGFPLLTKRVEKGGTEKDYRMTTELLDVHHESVPADEFHVSHYGLPEPDFRSPGRHWPVWLFINVGLACVVLGCLVWWRKRKAPAAG